MVAQQTWGNYDASDAKLFTSPNRPKVTAISYQKQPLRNRFFTYHSALSAHICSVLVVFFFFLSDSADNF
jgi:hypothetical protein